MENEKYINRLDERSLSRLFFKERNISFIHFIFGYLFKLKAQCDNKKFIISWSYSNFFSLQNGRNLYSKNLRYFNLC